jgi:ATP-dependent protease ClpP protease subunit
MVHEGFSMQSGKASDMRAANKHLQWIEDNCNILLGEKTNKDRKWWEENAITDMYLTPEEALDLGIIDDIL